MKEKRKISQEAIVRGIVVIRTLFEEGLTPGNDSFWANFEGRSGNLRADEQSLRNACFEFWFNARMLPTKAAQMLLDEIPQYRIEKAMGNVTEDQNQEYVDRLAGFLFSYYPENVQERLSQKASQ